MVINEPLTTKGNGNLEELGGSSVALAHSLDAPRTLLEKEDCDAERAAFIMARCS